MVANFRAFCTLVLALLVSTNVLAQESLSPRVYPNPIAENRHVTVEVADAAGATPEIVDLLGRTLTPDADLAAGTYLVRARHADGRVSPPASVTLATPGRVDLRLTAGTPSALAPSVNNSTANDYALIYILGDSQAAGKGDEDTVCDLRPEAGTRGYVYQRSTDNYVPVCDPSMDLYNGSIIPSLVDEVYTRYGKISLIVSYTVKGSHLTPEATSTDNYWYTGDGEVSAGGSFENARVILKRAKRAAQRDFEGSIQPAGAIHSFGGVDAKMYMNYGAPTPDVFESRLRAFDRVLSASNLTALYFEVGPIPDKPQFDGPAAEYSAAMEAVIPSERIAYFSDYVNAQYLASGSELDDTLWFVDRSGHLGALGLDYLGTQLAIGLDL